MDNLVSPKRNVISNPQLNILPACSNGGKYVVLSRQYRSHAANVIKKWKHKTVQRNENDEGTTILQGVGYRYVQKNIPGNIICFHLHVCKFK